MSSDEIGLVVMGAMAAATLGGVGGAFGAAWSVRKEMTDMKAEQTKDVSDLRSEHDNRLTRVETRVGITQDGALTGNGLIGTVAQLRNGR